VRAWQLRLIFIATVTAQQELRRDAKAILQVGTIENDV